MITEEELKKLELYPEFLITKYDNGFRRVEYSQMLAGAYRWNQAKRHYYAVRDFFGETSAEDCGAWCIAQERKAEIKWEIE